MASTDAVYHLGNFAMGDPERYPAFHEVLNGEIILVREDHDDSKMQSVLARMGFADVIDNAIIEVDDVKLWLNHYPLGVPDHRGRPFARPQAPAPYDIILCGHVHQLFKVQNGNVHLGVDVWSFSSISVFELSSAPGEKPESEFGAATNG